MAERDAGHVTFEAERAPTAFYPEPMTCPACGAAVPESSRFCSSCGHALVSRPDERRVATVLFADLVGFTTFSESSDPEHVKNLVDLCFERLVDDLLAFGGQVDKIVGDAIVGLFGAPIAHENDADRAVRAALRMQETLANVRDELGVAAELRVGVNTGEVLVGALRAGGDYTAMGDAVNVASRLQTAAPPGGVLVGPDTYAATRDTVRYESLGALDVKGRDEAIPAWLARGALAPAGQRRARMKAPLVGRDAELGVLCTLVRNAVVHDRAHLVLLVGDAGVGKTRLTRELGRLASEEHGATVLISHCAPYGEANVWFPVAEALRHACGIEDADAAESVYAKVHTTVRVATGLGNDHPELERVVAGLLYLLGMGGPGVDVDPARARDEAMRSVQVVFEALAADRPLVVTVADLHWADDLVLELVDRLLARLRTRPFLLVATARPELETRWTPRPGRHNALFLDLDPLGADHSAALARALLGEAATPELVQLLVERSGGNPFFIEELAAVIVETGPDAVSSGLPVTLRGLVAARLDALDPGARAVLEDCAVIGPSGPTELVAELAAMRGEPDPGTRLGLLAERDLLELDQGDFTFKTELIREVAYETLTKSERARRHAAITQHLADRAEQTGRVEEVVDELAHHFGAAAALVKELGTVEGVPSDLAAHARTFLARAIRGGEARDHWPSVTRLASMGLMLVGPENQAEHLEFLLVRARARVELREADAATADLDAAARLADELGDPRAAARALTLRGPIATIEHDPARARETLERAIARWRELGDDAGLAEALRLRGMNELFLGALDDADRAITEAIDTFRKVGDRQAEAWALGNLAFIAFMQGDTDAADGRVHDAITTFGELGDWGGVSWGLGLLAWVRFMQGQLDEAARLGQYALDEAVAGGRRWERGIMQVLLADIALWRGRTLQALEYANETRREFIELGDAWGEVMAIAAQARALACLGRLDDARQVLIESDAVVARFPEGTVGRMPDIIRAALAVQAGTPDGAAHAALLDDDAFGSVLVEQYTSKGLARLQAGDVAGGRELLEQAAGQAGPAGPAAAAAGALALVRDAEDRAPDALALVDDPATQPITYLDRMHHAIARAFALLRLERGEEGLVILDAAVADLDATEARLDQAVVRLARVIALEALQHADAGEARRALQTRLDALPAPLPGWERAFRLAAGTGA